MSCRFGLTESITRCVHMLKQSERIIQEQSKINNTLDGVRLRLGFRSIHKCTSSIKYGSKARFLRHRESPAAGENDLVAVQGNLGVYSRMFGSLDAITSKISTNCGNSSTMFIYFFLFVMSSLHS